MIWFFWTKFARSILQEKVNLLTCFCLEKKKFPLALNTSHLKLLLKFIPLEDFKTTQVWVSPKLI